MSNYSIFYGHCTFAFLHMSICFIFPDIISQFRKFLLKSQFHGETKCGIAVQWNAADAAAKSLQSCPTLCDPRDGSPPGFPVPGILQARTPEWVAISFSNA